MPTINLEELRRRVLETQQSGNTSPSDPNKQLFVDREGNIKTNRDVSGKEQITELQQEVFQA